MTASMGTLLRDVALALLLVIGGTMMLPPAPTPEEAPATVQP